MSTLLALNNYLQGYDYVMITKREINTTKKFPQNNLTNNDSFFKPYHHFKKKKIEEKIITFIASFLHFVIQYKCMGIDRS